MANIFISYSRRDSVAALALSEILRSAGHSVWIDQHGIEAAAAWSAAIVDAIDDADAIILLLSASSIVSPNVAKEISLAGERAKLILPLDLEPVTLPRELAYHLAGIQRITAASTEAILRALANLGLEATGEPGLARSTAAISSDTRKSLMIMPFDDISPEKNNAWFADGIVSELIAHLAELKLLKLIDWNTAKHYRTSGASTSEIAKQLDVRYFLQGAVRKFGDQIKITVQLLDSAGGEHIWNDAHRGTFDDIFEIQEKVAQRIFEGLKVTLTPSEWRRLEIRDTENAEAYEFYLRASEYFWRETKHATLQAIDLFDKAIELDPKFARAMQRKVFCLTDLYRLYDRDIKYLEAAERTVVTALRERPDFVRNYNALAEVQRLQGKLKEAEETAKEFVRVAPSDHGAYFTLGFFYMSTDRFSESIEPFEQCIRIMPDNYHAISNLVEVAERIGNDALRRKWAAAGLPIYERMLRLSADDDYVRLRVAHFQIACGKISEGLATASSLVSKLDVDSEILAQLALLHVVTGEHLSSFALLGRAVDSGLTNVDAYLQHPSFAPHVEHLEYKALVQKQAGMSAATGLVQS